MKARLPTPTLGPLVRIDPNELVVGDSESWKRICGARTQCCLSDWYDGFREHPDENNVFSQRDSNLHTELPAKIKLSIDNKIAVFTHFLEKKYPSTESALKIVDLEFWGIYPEVFRRSGA
jgi:hypothetical protein